MHVDGVFTGNPDDKASRLIEKVNAITEVENHISLNRSSFGRGGMLTKATMALKMADLGVEVYIANGTKKNVLIDLVTDNARCTFFPAKRKIDSTRKWIASSEKFAKGVLKINQGAVKAMLENEAASLLPIGVESISGDFYEKDIVRVEDETNNVIGWGRISCSSNEAASLIGKKGKKALIHYNYLYIKD